MRDLYHLGKANVVANALSRKTNSAPIQDMYLRMNIATLLLELIKEALAKEIEEEN